MKIAIISDLHGNHYALEEVLKEARIEKIEKILVLGDIVGYFYNPEKIFDLLSKWNYILIQGNHERLLAKIISGEMKEVDVKKKYGSGHRAAIKKLSSDQINILINAPESLLIEEENIKILMCHGAPWNPDFYIYPNSSEDIMNRCNYPEIDFIFIGHSHYQFYRKNKHSILVNVGSVGQSRLKGGVANWAILNTKNQQIELKSTTYCVKSLINEICNDDPKYLKEILLRS